MLNFRRYYTTASLIAFAVVAVLAGAGIYLLMSTNLLGIAGTEAAPGPGAVTIALFLTLAILYLVLLIIVRHAEKTILRPQAELHHGEAEALRQRCAYLQQIIDENPHFIFAKDRQGRFTMANEAFAEAYGTTVEALLGRTDADFNPNEELVGRYNRDELAVIETGQELFIPEDRIINIKGQELWRNTFKRRIVAEDGEGYQVLGVASDITALKEAEEVLTRAREQAWEANRLKSQFLANVSHDMRTPLGAILGYAEILQEDIYGPLNDKQRTAITEIIDSAGQLLEFMNNLMNLARIESGEIALTSTQFEPAELLNDVSTSTRPMAHNKELELTTNITDGAPAKVVGDRYWLQQVLLNLVGNAITHHLGRRAIGDIGRKFQLLVMGHRAR